MMKSPITPIIITIVLGTLVSILIGLLVSGIRIFNIYQLPFQYVASAIIASVFYAILQFSGRRDAFLVLVMLFVLGEGLERNFEIQNIIKNLLYIASAGITVYIYSEIIMPKISGLKFGKFLTFASLFTLYGVLLYFVLFLVHRGERTLADAKKNGVEYISFQFLVGLGIGLGLEIAQIVIGSTMLKDGQLEIAASEESNLGTL
jgi:hypothetical protein